MEYLDLYDENKKLTGKKILRNKNGYNLKKGNYINIVIIFIKNDENKFLIQKTSKQKGSIWATTGGHVKSGQTCDDAIIEEVREELGIDISLEKVELFKTIKYNMYYQDIYYLEKNIDIKDLKIQEEEVEFVKWLSINEINELIKKGEFRYGNIDAFKYMLEKLNIDR